MAFWNTSIEKRNALVLDLTTSSVGGAYVHLEESGLPRIVFSERFSVERREHEDETAAMLRTFQELCDVLVRDGAPECFRETGSARLSHALISVSAPWQTPSVSVEVLENEKPFTYSHAIERELLDRVTSAHAADEKTQVHARFPIATKLNGYDMPEPYGRAAKRAEVTMLSSVIARSVTDPVEHAMRSTFSIDEIAFTGFAPATYRALHTLYPHEKDFITVCAEDTATDLLLVSGALLTDVERVSGGIESMLEAAAREDRIETGSTRALHQFIDPERNARFTARVDGAERAFIESLRTGFIALAKRHALSRTLFLVARSDVRDLIHRLLDSEELRSLWLTDESLRLIPVLPEQFASKLRGEVSGDTYLALLTYFDQVRRQTHS